MGTLAIVFAAALVVTGCGSSGAGTSPETADTGVSGRLVGATTGSVAERLAQAQRGSPVPSDSGVVKRIRRQLVKLDRKCTERREKLAELVIAARERLAESGIKRSIPKVLEKLNASIRAADGRVGCARRISEFVELESVTAP